MTKDPIQEIEEELIHRKALAAASGGITSYANYRYITDIQNLLALLMLERKEIAFLCREAGMPFSTRDLRAQERENQIFSPKEEGKE